MDEEATSFGSKLEVSFYEIEQCELRLKLPAAICGCVVAFFCGLESSKAIMILRG